MARLPFTSHQRSWFTRLGLAILVTLFVLAFTQDNIFRLGVLQRLELATLDYRFQFRGVRQSIADSPHVIIVEITEESFRSLPARFPWPRSYYAHLLRNLRAAGAKAVGIDLLLSSADNYAPENDDSLREAIRETGIAVFAGKRETDSDAFIKTSELEDYGNIFFRVDSSIGLVNIRNDADGVYRTYNTMFAVEAPGGREILLPTLAFGVLNKYFAFPPLTVPVAEGNYFLYAGRRIPRIDAATILVNYSGPNGTFPHIRFHDVIDDENLTTSEEAQSGEPINTFSDSSYGYLHDGTFRDKIVIVGVTVPEYKDLFPVSIARGKLKRDNMMYGVEIHANVIESVLRNDFLTTESGEVEAAVTLALVLITFFLSSALRELKTRQHVLVALTGFLAAAGLVVLIVVLSVVLFVTFSYVLWVVSASLAVIGGYVVSTTYHYVTERRERLMIKSMFSTYVNPTLVDQLVANPEKLVLGGKREELTVMFSDIEGFTAFAETMQPEELVSILNEYLSIMSGIIFRNDGTLDKYEGDAVMAFWGAPIPQEDHALHACRAALEMQESLGELNAAWGELGRPAIRVRIGINTGDMVVGNMGAEGKFAYTVIGDSVNLASRLEGANKEYRTSVMVSERTYSRVKDVIVGRQLDRITVKGRSEPVTVFELLQLAERGVSPEVEEFLETYGKGLGAYYRKDWGAASTAFERALAVRPGDYPSRLHLERVQAYRVMPPPENWDGTFVMQRK